MKKIYLVLSTLFFCSVMQAQDTAPGEYNAQVKYTGSNAAGTISVTATGLGKNKEQSIKNAVAGAFYTLMFRGVPGSQYELPMVPDENGKKNNAVITAILEGGYNAFLIESKVTAEWEKKKKKDGIKGKMTENMLTINCDALRRYLEKNNVIRKFGI